jgi:hypothetical protein
MRKALLAALVAASLAAPPALGAVAVGITVAPPAPRFEPVPPPRPGWAWHRGHWVWWGNRYVWWKGYWMAGRPGWRWHAGYWTRRGPNWSWHRGYWAHG